MTQLHLSGQINKGGTEKRNRCVRRASVTGGAAESNSEDEFKN